MDIKFSFCNFWFCSPPSACICLSHSYASWGLSFSLLFLHSCDKGVCDDFKEQVLWALLVIACNSTQTTSGRRNAAQETVLNWPLSTVLCDFIVCQRASLCQYAPIILLLPPGSSSRWCSHKPPSPAPAPGCSYPDRKKGRRRNSSCLSILSSLQKAPRKAILCST